MYVPPRVCTPTCDVDAAQRLIWNHRLRCSTHQSSLHGRCRCSLPLCGRTPLRSGRGWSSTSWSPSHSNPPWSPLGIGSAGPRWDGLVGTRWRVRRWRGQSCWSEAPKCTSCSSGKAPANTRCHQMAEPGLMWEDRWQVWVRTFPGHILSLLST